MRAARGRRGAAATGCARAAGAGRAPAPHVAARHTAARRHAARAHARQLVAARQGHHLRRHRESHILKYYIFHLTSSRRLSLSVETCVQTRFYRAFAGKVFESRT